VNGWQAVQADVALTASSISARTSAGIQRIARMRPMTGSAKQKLDCFVALLLAMTGCNDGTKSVDKPVDKLWKTG
jgi:hypothetical protein